MRTRKNWLRTTIAMITLIATVIETGFSSVATYAAVLDTDDSVIVNDVAGDEVLTDDKAADEDVLSGSDDAQEDSHVTEIDITAPTGDKEDIAAPGDDQGEPAEKTDEQKDKKLDVSESGISGSGYDEITIYIDTKNLATNDSFKVKFIGADSAEYNPVLNDSLDKTNGGKYIFDALNGEGFSIRATSTDNVILSYKYNNDGDPMITAASKSVDKSLGTKILTAVDDTKISAIEGEGYESITIDLDTEDLTAKDVFKFYVESNAPATVDGKSAIVGIEGLTKSAGPITVENLEGKSFVAYVVSDSDDSDLETVAEVTSIEKGTATIDVNGVATKRVYEYEDSKVYVRATLSKADAIPDDAYFAVTPLEEEDAAKYLEFLNSNKEEEAEEYNEFNTLLYDIAFYTDESKSEEIEPEDGSVTVSVEFKQNQVSEDLGIEDKENIEVTHIIENGSAMEAETLAVKQTGDVDTVEVVTDSFSVFVIKGISNGQVNVGEPGYESPEAMLGSAWLYGITANTWEFDGESETSFAAKSLVNKGNGGQTGANKSRTPDSRYQYSMVGEVSGTTPIKIKGFSCELTAPKSEQGKFFNSTDDGGSLTFVTMDKVGVDSRIDGMISYVTGESDRLAALNSIKNYNGLPQGDSAGKLEINITGAEDGAYYIDVDKYPALLHAFTVSSGVKIIKNPGQKLVFNFNGTGDYQLDKFSIEQNGVPFDSTGIANITKQGEPCVAEDIIFNFPKAANILAHDVAGIFLAPRSTFKFTGVDGGWLVANKAISNAEWHFLNSRVTEPKPSSLRVEIPVNKRFIGGQGQWREGFTFTLERLDASGKNVQNDSQTPQTITFKAGDSDTATQSFFLDFDDTKPGNIHWDRNDDGTYWGYEYVHQEWYRISELKDRSDVNYDILLSEFGFYRGNNGKYYDKDGNVVDEDYWYVHLFIYKDDQEYWRSGQYKDKAEYRTVIRTARINPATFNWSNPLPCENDRPIWFVNEFVKPVTVVLEGEKFVNGDDKYVPTGKFTFTLQNYTRNNQWQAPTAKYTVTNDGSHFTFPEIELDLNGPTGKEVDSRGNGKYYYYYKISESNNCAPYGPDPAVYIAKVTVTKDGTNLSTKVDYFRFPNANSVNCSYAQQNKQCNGVKITSLYFNNTYEANGHADIYGLKLLEGRDFDPDDEFTFKLLLVEGEKKNVLQTKTFKVGEVAGEGFSFKFDTIDYDINDDGKTYNYLVQEEAGSAAGMNYDTTEYPVTIKVSDIDKNGQLTIDQKKGTQADPVTITNRYKANGEVPFYAHKIYPLKTKLSETEVFKFQLKGGKVGEAETVNEIKSITGPGQVEFTSVKFAKEKNATSGLLIDETGTYKYTIQEVIPEGAVDYTTTPRHTKIKDGIIYDARIYNITVTVTDGKNGKLIVKKTGGYDNEPQDAIKDDENIDPGFENDYRYEPVKDPIPGTKRFPGGSLEPGMFTFKLEADPDDAVTVAAVKDGTVVLPNTTVQNGIPESKFKANEFAFEDITYNAAGTYRFKITESAGTLENVIYSDKVFYITKVVRDNGKGQLEVSKSDGLPIEFVNPLVKPNSVRLIAYKELYGQTLKPGQFKFDLIYDGKVLETASNDEYGVVLFSEINYDITQLGKSDSRIFSYQIKEQIPVGAKDLGDDKYLFEGMTYDGHIEDVDVKVEKVVDTSGNVSLLVKPTNATTDIKAVFINEYVASGETDFGGHKKLLGRKFEKEDENNWQAVLYNDKGEEVRRANIVQDNTFIVNHGGKFNFAPLQYTTKIVDPETGKATYIDYTKPVTYNFTVKEEGRNVPNVRNSDEVYMVKVTVADDGKGHLDVTHKKYTKDGTPIDDILFINEYMTDNSVRFHALKKTNGAALEDKMFSFELWDEATSTTKPIQTKYNFDGGNIWFDPITYVKNDSRDDTRPIDDPYIYKIKEKIENRKGWTLATNEYIVKVWVTYNETTQNIDVEHHYYAEDENGQLVQVENAEVIFLNTYEAYGEVTPYAEKVVTDREVPAGKFKFILTDENGKSYEATNEYAPVGETARATFETLKFNLKSLEATDVYPDPEKKDTYYKYYTMVEDIPSGSLDLGNGYYKYEGYTYDGQVYIVKVVLTDKGDGEIATDWFAYPAGGRLQKLTFMEKIVKFVTGNDPQKHALFTNRYDATGSLEITAKKAFVGKELEADKFTFRLTGKDEAGDVNIEKKNAADGIVDFGRFDYTKEGDYTYTVKELIPTDAKEVPEGSGIWVKDGVTYDNTEYTLNVSVRDNKKGALDITVILNNAPVATVITVATDGSDVVTFDPEVLIFTNTYAPAPVTVHPGGIKTLIGRDIEPAEFEFHMTSDTGNPKAYDKYTKNDGNTFTFPDIVFTEADMRQGKGYAAEKEFWYTLKETKGNAKGVTYSEEEYKFVVKVTDINGQLDAKVIRDDIYVKYQEVKQNEIAEFFNWYDANGTFSVPVHKIVEGTDDKDKEFTFELLDEQSKKKEYVTLKAGETKYFTPFDYSLGMVGAGQTKVFNYTVHEVKPDVIPGGWTYCNDVYTVEVTVKDDNSGQLDVSHVYKFNGGAYDKEILDFTNTYTATGSTPLDGYKVLENGDKLTGGEFAFILEKKDGTDADGKPRYSWVETVENDASGNFSFTDLSFTMDDIGNTFEYRVREDIPDPKVEGMIYDETQYSVVIQVSDNKDGTLKIDKVVTDSLGNTVKDCKFRFKNTVVEPDKIYVQAEKTLEGLPLSPNMFSFTLKGDGVDETIKNDGSKITFSPIQYTLADAGKSFKYTVYEHGENPLKNIAYDKTQYTVNVDVKLVDNKLVIDRKNYREDESGVTQVGDFDIKFFNKYSDTVEVPLSGSKELSGFPTDAPSIGKYTYQFGLYDSKGNLLQTKEVTPTDNKTPVAYAFDNLVFTEADYDNSANASNIFEYTVKEIVPVYEKDRAPNVEYARNEYNVTVELYMTLENDLEARVSTKQNVPTDKLNFTNIYKADGTEQFSVIKHITGKELEDAAYTFELTGEGQNQSKTNSGNLVVFDPIQYTADDIGVHTYTIKETAAKDGSTIDTRVYYGEVTVDEGTQNALDISKKVYMLDKDGTRIDIDPSQPIPFENTYEAKGEINLEGIKIMHSRPLAAGDFSFILKDENGTPIQTVTHAAASLNNKKDLEARAAFAFDAIKFTQEDLKAPDGGYLPQITKYYTVEEQIGNKGGVTYSHDAYVVEITVKDNHDKTLSVTKKVQGRKDVKKENGGIADFLKSLIGKMGEAEDQIIFENEYDSECIIDPPILRKQIVGRSIVRGEFMFMIQGPGLRSMGEEESGYVRYIQNGLNPVDKSIYYPDGREIPEGELYVGDIKYKYIDLVDDESFSLEKGANTRTFVYTATEVNQEQEGIHYSDQKFELKVTCVENGDGTISVINANGLVVNDDENDKEHKLFWSPINPYYYNDEQMQDTFINTHPGEGYIDIVGAKKLEGRLLRDDDEFEFTLTDDATGKSVTRKNTKDDKGVPRLVNFNAQAKDGIEGIDFLNYRVDMIEEGVSSNHVFRDDRGEHVYTITEKASDKAGIKYDTSTFKVYVDVQEEKDANGKTVYNKNGTFKLGAKITKIEKIYSDNNKVAFDFSNNCYFEFVNEFKATGHVEFTGSKVVNDPLGKDAGLAGSLKDKYNFAIYQYTDEARTQGKNLIDVKSTDASGKFTLSVPDYDQDVLKNDKGEYVESKTLYYRIIETKPSNGSWTENNTVFESEGIIYDNTEYDVDVTVTYDGTPELKVSKNVKKAGSGQAISGIIFTNVESVEYTDVKGTKTWIDNVKDASTRPDVVVSLYSSAVGGGKKVINTYTIKAPALTYEFSTDAAGDPLPKYDANGKNIKYTVTEAPITGYLSEQKGYDFFNTKGTIKIQKIDADTNEPLAGATLAIYDGKTLVEKWTTGNSAHVVEKDLTPGKTYTLRETAAPEGYDLAADISFTVPADGSDITVTMSDKPIIGSVRLTKLDSETRKTLAGAEFSLYTNEGTRIYATGTAGKYSVKNTTSNGVFATSSAGSLEITDLPKGTYYFVETKAPEGYILSSEKLSFTIADSKALIEVSFLNKQSVASVKLRKVGSTSTRGLEGAEFELYAKTPRTSSQAISSTIYPNGYYRYGTYKTDSSGEIKVTDLPWDEYYFVETKAPEGYTIAKDIGGETLAYTFTVDAANAGSTIDLGDIVNNPEEIETGVLGERIPPEEKQSGVLGVRSAPKKGVLGTRVGPATGDASAIALWLTLLVACVGTIIWMLASKRRKSLGKQ